MGTAVRGAEHCQLASIASPGRSKTHPPSSPIPQGSFLPAAPACAHGEEHEGRAGWCLVPSPQLFKMMWGAQGLAVPRGDPRQGWILAARLCFCRAGEARAARGARRGGGGGGCDGWGVLGALITGLGLPSPALHGPAQSSRAQDVCPSSSPCHVLQGCAAPAPCARWSHPQRHQVPARCCPGCPHPISPAAGLAVCAECWPPAPLPSFLPSSSLAGSPTFDVSALPWLVWGDRASSQGLGMCKRLQDGEGEALLGSAPRRRQRVQRMFVLTSWEVSLPSPRPGDFCLWMNPIRLGGRGGGSPE